MALDRVARGFASLREAMQEPDPAEDPMTLEQASSRPNSGLALLEAQDPGAERLVETAGELQYSPMFWLAAAEYRAALRRVLREEPEDAAEQEEWALRKLCARLFLAGEIAGKAEVPR